ncbi:MAG: response regulator transcription factor [Hyphomicrobium zavarzinii]|jgi:DNA-binding NarL/FixJ family response regulator|uniref:response regulator n=1 Tax=Hyphomicrobium TaxID=81 RepID=UPI0003617F29|nr:MULTISPECIES: response regulator transcription factor [Hyphomicrobium]MBL8846117.1 response regulator transcription factor [Hyphomicrobium zavarzinii]WBT37581.1 response regulator transcription factor [Hyphomicrobium sp. DMF-1]HML44280.1 response regulator transcription factor [Hyphomicrobium zavarzinii]
MKILVVDDHAVVREGIRRLLATISGAEIHEAANAQDAMNLSRTVNPDVVVLDINLDGSSGLELLRRLKAENVAARIVMFTMHSEPSYAMRALKAGAAGYVSKSAEAGELVTAVKKIASGDRYLDRSMASELVFSSAFTEDPLHKLSNREVEILRLLGEGKSLAEIAATFGIAYKTVANSCSRLKEKLGVERTADLIRLSVERRIR